MSAAFQFRTEPDDFIVDEIAETPPEPQGQTGKQSGATHVWFKVTKRGVSTTQAAARIAEALGKQANDVAFAGRKDAVAVTTQLMSVEHVEFDALLSLDLEDIEISEPVRAQRRLRLGQLVGNRFKLRLRGLDARLREAFEDAFAQLCAAGIPNRYGPQRFGRDGLSWCMGEALVRLDALRYLRAVGEAAGIGYSEATNELLRRAEHGTQGDRRRASDLVRDLPTDLRPVARELARRRHKDPVKLLRSVPTRTRAFHLSALQSRLFNAVVDMRTHDGTLFESLDGDVLVPSEWDSARDAAATSPSGPMWATKLAPAAGRPGEIESTVLQRAGLTRADFAPVETGLRPRGARRALVVVPRHGSIVGFQDEPVRAGAPDCVSAWVTFELPPGAYATSVLAVLDDALEPLN